tara:strand:- start:27 stop:215 length:189 start_codon:yes stop_codon:yes gene_type:complete
MNGWFYRRAAAPNFTLTQHFPRCERMQRENQIHTMGSKLMGWMAPAPTGVAMRHTVDVHICL